MSVKPKRLHLDENESRRSRSAAEHNPKQAGAQYDCNLGDDRGTEDVMQRRRRNCIFEQMNGYVTTKFLY